MRFLDVVRAIRATGRIGLTAAGLVFVAAIAAATGFFDPASLAITLGGTFAVVWATFPRERLLAAWDTVSAAYGPGPSTENLVAAVKRLARVHRDDGPRGLEAAVALEADERLRHAVTLALECRDEQEARDVLAAEARVERTAGEDARQVVLTFGKLFPAFGLIGTLIGLGLLLRNLTTADVSSIGPGLAVAVLTTLYGAILANVVVLPIATKVQTHLTLHALHTQMTIDGVLLVLRQEYPSRIERALRAYAGAAAPRATPPAHRMQLLRRGANEVTRAA